MMKSIPVWKQELSGGVHTARDAVVIGVALLRGGFSGGVVPAVFAADAAPAARQQCGGAEGSGDTDDAFFHGWMLLSFVKAPPKGEAVSGPDH